MNRAKGVIIEPNWLDKEFGHLVDNNPVTETPELPTASISSASEDNCEMVAGRNNIVPDIPLNCVHKNMKRGPYKPGHSGDIPSTTQQRKRKRLLEDHEIDHEEEEDDSALTAEIERLKEELSFEKKNSAAKDSELKKLKGHVESFLNTIKVIEHLPKLVSGMKAAKLDPSSPSLGSDHQPVVSRSDNPPHQLESTGKGSSLESRLHDNACSTDFTFPLARWAPMQPATIDPTLNLCTRYPLQLGAPRQCGIQSLPDTSTHGQHWESNPKPSDLESNILSTGPHAPMQDGPACRSKLNLNDTSETKQRIPYALSQRCAKKDVNKRVNQLMTRLFSREVMASHSLTGRPRTPSEPAKPALDPQMVHAITENVLENVTGSRLKDVRAAITAKLASAANCMKRALTLL